MIYRCVCTNGQRIFFRGVSFITDGRSPSAGIIDRSSRTNGHGIFRNGFTVRTNGNAILRNRAAFCIRRATGIVHDNGTITEGNGRIAE